MLQFVGSWRFSTPPNGRYNNTAIPQAALGEFRQLIDRVARQGNRWDILEHFKRAFSRAACQAYMQSSSESWADTDLGYAMSMASENTPMFLEAFFDACEALRERGLSAPDTQMINEVCERHDIGYAIDSPTLLLREGPVAPVSAPPRISTLAERDNELLQQSLNRSEELLHQGRPREAVQESLWVLETVTTAFRGIDFSGDTVGGRYFNQIVRELRRLAQGTTLDRVAEWSAAVHGYLSSPNGGGVRHGLDLNAGVQIGRNEGLLFCNLIRSFIGICLENMSEYREVPSVLAVVGTEAY
ncbi:MAG TPA: hypothetical protein VHM88_20390 [Candidatus Acidoferrales bacterium]|nr:hypothetical protein [Candidatus Acidoferrales bacterium]